MFDKDLALDIIALYDSNLLNLFSINEISKRLGKKYPYVNKKVTSLIEEGILQKITIGRSHLCSLNLENEKTILLLSLNEMNKHAPDKKKVKEFIRRYNLGFTVYSVVKYEDKLVFILNNLRERRKIENHFDNAIALDESEFLDMMAEDSSLFSNHIVLYGYERFFELITNAREELKRVYSPVNY